MGQTLNAFKLFTRNFSEADTCTIWNYNMKSQTGQKENANDWQTFEHRPKTWKKCPKKIGPRFDQFGPDCYRAILLYKPGFSKTVSTSHIKLIWTWQAPIHVSKSKIHVQDSMHQAHAHHPWSMHVAPPKSWILRAAQDPGGFWRLKPSLNSVSEVIWLTIKFHQILIFSSNFQFFHVHGSDLNLAITLSTKFFRSSYLHHPKLHAHSWGWTKG